MIKDCLIEMVEISSRITNPFFNTVNLEGKPLKKANDHARRQEAEILAFFNSRVGMYTPAEVHAAFPQWPITSIRRAITNLTNRGQLRKTTVKRVGEYGVSNFCWTVV